MGISIREADLRDSPAIVRLLCELADSAGETTPVTEAYVARYLASPSSKVLVAEVDGEAAGLLTYSVRPDLYHAAPTGLIEELVVSRSRRGRGIGGALVDELFARLAELGCAEVSVTTLPGNTGAIEFYKEHGLTDEALFLEKHFPETEQ